MLRLHARLRWEEHIYLKERKYQAWNIENYIEFWVAICDCWNKKKIYTQPDVEANLGLMADNHENVLSNGKQTGHKLFKIKCYRT